MVYKISVPKIIFIATSLANFINGAVSINAAAPSIRNVMTDLIRNAFARYEQRMTDIKDGFAFQKIRLDESVPHEEQRLIYTAASFSGQVNFVLCANPAFVHGRIKSACH